MKFNFKKITAIGASALLTGMSIAAPLAAANYPQPFVVGGVANVAIVYGTGTGVSSLDIIQAGNIQSNLQASMGTASGGTAVGVSGEATQFETGTDKLNIGDNLTEIRTVAIRDTDLSTVLADGTFSNAENEDFDYEQKIEVSADLEYAYFADSDYENKAPTLGVKITKKDLVLNYTLDFIKSAEDDTGGANLEDYEDSVISFLGKTYDIVDAVNQSAGMKLTLMSGAVKDTLDLNSEGTYTANGNSYDVGLTYVDNSNYCRFSVNGVPTDKILKGGIDKLADGTYIGVADVDYSTGAVTEIMRCRFYLGADKIVLEDTKEVSINSEDVDELRVYFDETDATPFKWNKMILEWKAEKDLFITENSEVTMPGFGSIKLTAGGLTTVKEETTEIRGDSNDEVVLTTTIKSGATSISLLGSNGTGGFDAIGGASAGELLLTSNASGAVGGGVVDLNYSLLSGSTEHQYFVATYWSGSTGSSYLVEVSDADDTYGVDFKDVVSGKTLAENIKNGTDFTIGDASFNLNLFEEDSYVKFDASNSNTYVDRLITEEGLMIYLPIAATGNCTIGTTATSPEVCINSTQYQTSYIIRTDEENKDGTLGGGKDINVTVSHTSSHNVEAKIATAAESVFSGTDMLEDPDDDNYYTAYVEYDCGTKVIYDSDPDEDTVDIIYYGEQSYGNVFIAEESAAITAGTAGTAGTTTQLGDVLVKDTEVSSVSSKNLIVVGGSCINSAAATALGVSQGTCGAAFTEATGVGSGQFLIKGVSDAFTTGKIALVVAGYEAADTVNAATYLRNQVVDTSKEYKGTSSTSATLVTTETA